MLLIICTTGSNTFLYLISGLYWSNILVFVSVLIAYTFSGVLIYQCLPGVITDKEPKSVRAKKQMRRTRPCLWLLLAILIAQTFANYYLATTLGEELKNAVGRNVEPVKRYNSVSRTRKIVLEFQNGTVLFAPEGSSCIRIRNTPRKREYVDQRVLAEDFAYAGLRLCTKEDLIVVSVETFSSEIDGVLLTAFIAVHATAFVLFAVWALLVSRSVEAFCKACAGKTCCMVRIREREPEQGGEGT